MADQYITCDSACTVLVRHEIVTPILDLSPDEGAQIAAAILVVWALAFGFRLLSRVLWESGNVGNES